MLLRPPMSAAGFLFAMLVGCGGPSRDPGSTVPPVVRVAPLEVRGQEGDAAYVGGAFAGSVARSLARASGLAVLGITTSDPTTHRLTGTLSREGKVNRVEARLVDEGTGTRLWQVGLQAPAGDLAGLAFRLAREAARYLAGSFPQRYEYVGDLSGGPAMAASPLLTVARETWTRQDFDGFLRATSALVESFPADPDAHALSAAALAIALDAAPSDETVGRLTERLAELERIDPWSPYPELMRAFVNRSSGQPERAQILYDRVLSRTDLGSRVRSWTLRQRSYANLQIGNTDAAREDAEAAVELDPAEAAGLFALSRAQQAAGDLDAAIVSARRALALEPEQWRYHQRLGLVLSLAGKPDDAVVSLRHACEQSAVQEACANLAVTLLRAGRDDEAQTAARHADSLAGTGWGLYNLACYRALAGETATALETLSRAIEQGFADVLLTRDSDLDSLRQTPQFDAIVTEVEDRIRARRRLLDTAFPWQS